MDKSKEIIAHITSDEKNQQTSSSSKRIHANPEPRRRTNIRVVQNFLLVWLDSTIDEANNKDCINTISLLREVVNNVNTFTDVDECIDFITNINEDKIFLIVSEAFTQIIIPVVEDIHHVSCIYIVCENKTQHEQSSKVKGVFNGIKPICEALKRAAHECDHNMVSISFVKPSDGDSKPNLDELDQSFMYTQILKEILLTIDFEEIHFNAFLTYCREQFAGNTAELKNIEKFEKEYRHHEPIWWYTYSCFLYSMLNKALRTMEVDLIIQMGFFIRDLHKHIAQLHSEQFGGENHSSSFTVFRGQGLSKTDFDQLMNTGCGLISFNNFLSTSHDQEVSFAFADSNQYNPDLIGVLFVITVNPSISVTPFAKVANLGHFQEEEEILFSMHSIFRIGQIKNINEDNRLWQVDLTLTNDNDPQLDALTQCIRKEIFPHTEGWYRLGQVLIKLGQFNKAEELYSILLTQTTNELEKARVYHMLGMAKNQQGKYTETVAFYEKSLEISQQILPPDHIDLAISYNNIGEVYRNTGEYLNAISYYEKALEIKQKTLPPNDLSYATSYNNIGEVHMHMGDYRKALPYCEKALEIKENALPPNHESLAISYGNIAGIYYSIGQYSRALSYYEKDLEIREKILPPNHPSLSTSYRNIGAVYNRMGEYLKALLSHEKSLEICQKSLPPNHPSLSNSYNSIGEVYRIMGQYSKALTSHEKALEIRQKTLPPNHPDLATSYNNIGLVYNSMGEYSKALTSYDKVLEIQQKTLSSNHPDLAISYNNIGSVYKEMGEYSKALSFHDKALEIQQKTLPSNHPNLASFYNNIGLVYYKMGEYSKALTSHEKALEIREKSLPPNYSSLATSYNNIGLVYNNMGEYSKALTYHEKALEIREKSLPPNYSSLATSYNNIGLVYNNMGEYSKALTYHEKALEIREKSLLPNQLSLATSYNNIGEVYRNMGEYSRALSFHEKALDIRQKNLPQNHPDLVASYNGIGTVYEIKGDFLKALQFYQHAAEIGQLSLPENHPDIHLYKKN